MIKSKISTIAGDKIIMRKTIRLTERDLTRLVNRIVNENMFDNSLYSDIMDVIRNSNSSHEETINKIF